ncbi:tetratricopeptide repeat-containing sensor histidine kinase [Algoriphagus persicinus]|uniref:tetratricopeptide repeat-containing sensor histidine kinase n=1 Tax=Algoriphagus persicinus TaxID=3108754 RepID=UPI002B389E69|nr:tetratricopeptide repeat-containing sensor histidine kinase [Algoriphagus sp. E1-3-M2]MEB2784484.1 tetratricopeptide repeat-containing sensor histidine kinase [Algoriphagus sp. E1-3-M2]
MKQLIFTLFFLFIWDIGFAQNPKIDSLRQKFAQSRLDEDLIYLYYELSDFYQNTNPDSAIIYAQKSMELAEKVKIYQDNASYMLGQAYRVNGDYPKALEFLFRALQLFEKHKNHKQIGECENQIGIVYSQLGYNPDAIIYQKRAIKSFESANDLDLAINSTLNLGRGYRRNNQFDSASIYLEKAYNSLDLFRNKSRHAFLFMEMGTLQFQLGNHNEAFNFLRESTHINELNNNHFYNSFAYNVLAVFFNELNQTDSCIFYAKKGFSEATEISNKYNILESSIILAQQYDSVNFREANFYLKKVNEITDELYGSKKVQELQKAISDEQQRQRKIEQDRVENENRIKQIALLVGFVLLLFIALLLYANNKRKHKANILLQNQKEEIHRTLEKLRSTQSQLIQSEKMASLGELTAGIAHEIQNPLNFVNNFSEVSSEMIDEMKEELGKKDIDEASAIADDIKQNLEKINHHGKRADAIVKGMLEHSRANKSEKSLTDLNALTDEFVRLSYHGLRAKDKSFNADFKLELDPDLPKVKVVASDIGRVILNLVNNAFYTVYEKAKSTPQPSRNVGTGSEGGEVYKPLVTVKTMVMKSPSGDLGVQISVKDNGNGIPDAIKEKIFQPFFTTKPTGSGTGLGLSLSYDMVKAHGGELTVNSREEKGSEFIIALPLL